MVDKRRSSRCNTFNHKGSRRRCENTEVPSIVQDTPKKNATIHICKFCSKTYKYTKNLKIHYKKCNAKNDMEIITHPPDREDEIERDKKIDLMLTMVKSQQEQITELKNALTASKTPQGFIYFIKSGPSKFKIGHTCEDIKNHLSVLQWGSPDKLVLFNKIACDNPEKFEKYLQYNFREQHIREDWYSLKSDDVNNLISFLNENSE